ncbi:Tetracycline repressor protein class B from transposon Tn10 [Streptomyces hundungensis]|uniref:Tetracycline repressor protein class B from transposon Tn10 n=1 Tax=Streptomyces hundungensis TaxID=1077946 RepID=A0A387HAM4_9ACTN|nr:TetR/AcrR family transcriptional regulator C-terminal domain-containing protein [Streptomyces hundungensis]AYG80906.1 Tetracycline repressor protein class B from transposon Tn10 [Streptomyces hundungensis]
MATTKIDRRQVADTALRLLNDTGLEGLTLRAIAKDLGVQAPALYWHFKNKEALLDEMATVMYRRMIADGLPGADADSWQGLLRAVNRALRSMLLSHRDGAKVYGGARFTGNDHAESLEFYLGVLIEAGFDLRDATRAATASYAYTMGFVAEEQGTDARPGETGPGVDTAERAQRLAAFPLAAAAGPEMFGSYDERFEEGLDVLIAGIEATYALRK